MEAERLPKVWCRCKEHLRLTDSSDTFFLSTNQKAEEEPRHLTLRRSSSLTLNSNRDTVKNPDDWCHFEILSWHQDEVQREIFYLLLV